jgi:hypothetical protein
MQKCGICGKEIKTEAALKAHHTKMHVQKGEQHMEGVLLQVLQSMQEQLKSVQSELEEVKRTQGETKEESERKLALLKQTLKGKRDLKQQAMDSAPIVDVWGDMMEDVDLNINGQKFTIKSGVVNKVPAPIQKEYEDYKKAIRIQQNIRAYFMAQGKREQTLEDIAAQVETLKS